MPWSGTEQPPERAALELRHRADRVKRYAIDIGDYEAAEKLRQFAAELEVRAAALERPIKSEVGDP